MSRRRLSFSLKEGNVELGLKIWQRCWGLHSQVRANWSTQFSPVLLQKKSRSSEFAWCLLPRSCGGFQNLDFNPLCFFFQTPIFVLSPRVERERIRRTENAGLCGSSESSGDSIANLLHIDLPCSNFSLAQRKISLLHWIIHQWQPTQKAKSQTAAVSCLFTLQGKPQENIAQ